MQITCRCARCGTSIPVNAELVGQTVLCPHCMERVYVTQPSEEERETSAAESPPPLTNLNEAAEILRRHQQAVASASETPVGLIIGTACAAILVVALVLLMVTRSRSPEKRDNVAADATPAPYPAAPPTTPSSSPAPQAALPPPEPYQLPPTPPQHPTASGQTAVASAAGPHSAPSGASSPAPGGRWAEVWTLPAVSMREPVVLVPLEDTPTPWAMLVRAADTDPRWPSNILLEPDSQAQAWLLVYSVVAPGSQVREPLARVWREGSELRFAWVVPAISSLGPPQLANCLLEVRAGALRKVVQFRQPQTIAPLVLELNRPKQILPLAISYPPRRERLCLEIVALEGFPEPAQLRGGIRIATATVPPGSAPVVASPMMPRPPLATVPVPALPPGMAPMVPGAGSSAAPAGAAMLVLELGEYPGVEIRLRLVAAADKPEVWVEPVYRTVAESEFPLTLAELDRQEAEAKKTLPAAEAALVKARSAMKRLQERDEKLQKNKATAKRNLELAEVQRLLAMSKAEEAKLLKQIEAAQAIAQSSEKLRKLIHQLDKQAKIQFVVYLEAGDPDVLLAMTTTPP